MNGIVDLIDTNIVIGILAGQLNTLQHLADLGASVPTSAVSQITRIELLSWPSMTAKGEVDTLALLSSVQVIFIDDAVEHTAIALRRRSLLKLPDAIIGATALAHGLRLITFDTKLQSAVAGAMPGPAIPPPAP